MPGGRGCDGMESLPGSPLRSFQNPAPGSARGTHPGTSALRGGKSRGPRGQVAPPSHGAWSSRQPEAEKPVLGVSAEVSPFPT